MIEQGYMCYVFCESYTRWGNPGITNKYIPICRGIRLDANMLGVILRAFPQKTSCIVWIVYILSPLLKQAGEIKHPMIQENRSLVINGRLEWR